MNQLTNLWELVDGAFLLRQSTSNLKLNLDTWISILGFLTRELKLLLKKAQMMFC